MEANNMIFRNKINKDDDYTVNLKDCLAKTEFIDGDTVKGMTVKEHCVLTGYIAKDLYSIIYASNNHIPSISQSDFIASLHDIGKISKPFQNMIYGSLSEKKNVPSYITPSKDLSTTHRHDSIGQVFVSEYGENHRDQAWSAISRVVGGHHGLHPSNEVFFAEDGIFGGKPYNEQRKELLKELENIFGNNLPKSITDEEISFLTGLTIVSDWISSAVSKEELLCSDYKSIALQKVRDAGYSKLHIKPGLSFKDIFGFEPHKVQKDFFESVNKEGTYILEVEMGKGKTEAALYASYKLLQEGKASGIYFALPTRLTSLSIHKRMLTFIDAISTDDSTAKLVFQNSNLYMNAYSENCSPGGDWFDERKRGILAPFGVGTIDQALMSVINVKHSSLRAFGLAGKVVIIDELHSYDEYTGSLILYLIKLIRKLGGTVIILSATLRNETKKNILGKEPVITSYPLITISQKENELQELQTTSSKDKIIEIIHGNKHVGIDQAISMSLKGGKVLWISNTVDEAQNVYAILKSRCNELGVVVGLLHSHFIQKDRKRIEDEYITYFSKKETRSNIGVILVGTQILEQSLDIDADLMVTEIAPIDMLLQRMGRLWRHKENNNHRPCNNPTCIILHPSFEKVQSDVQNVFGVNGVIYSPYVLYRTLKAIRNIVSISVPSEIRSLIESTYVYEDPENQSIKKAYDDLLFKRSQMENEARNAKNLAQVTKNDNEVMTRYQTQKTSTLLLLKSYDPQSRIIELLDGHIIKLKETPSKQERISIASLLIQNTMTLSTKIIPEEAFILDKNSMLSPYIYFGEKENKELGVLLFSDKGKLFDVFKNEIITKEIDYSHNIGYKQFKESIYEQI